jgi:hypothetical protein
MSTDFRALCAELIKQMQELHTMVWGEAPHLLDEDRGGNAYLDLDIEDVLEKARLALTQPEPVAPTDEEWEDLKERLWNQYETIGYQGERFMYDSDFGTALDLVRQELTRYARPAIQPVPVSERLPGPEDCTAQGWCWVLYRSFATWTLEPPLGQDGKHTGYTHWLPHWALPVPTPANTINQEDYE